MYITVYHTNRQPIKDTIGVVMNRLVGMALKNLIVALTGKMCLFLLYFGKYIKWYVDGLESLLYMILDEESVISGSGGLQPPK